MKPINPRTPTPNLQTIGPVKSKEAAAINYAVKKKQMGGSPDQSQSPLFKALMPKK